ncbi:MAG: TetR/AcrR family transcriptional regulator [Microthrixaceae bacterium]|nr:TetR/AcrR family transcriptional regulator [Microthrixaceae bacterium]
MRRSVGVDIDDLLASITRPVAVDELSERILDAASELFATIGVRRTGVEDIAERSGLGRTTVYRRFEGRQQIVEAVLAREVHRFFGSILRSTAHLDRFEDVVIESFLTGMQATEASLLATLVRAEPDLLQLMTIDAGPMVSAAREFLVDAYRATHDEPGSALATDHVAMFAELLVRLAISLVLTPQTVIPVGDDDESRAVLHRLLDPLIAQFA